MLSEQPTVSKQKFNYSFLYLLDFEDNFNAADDVEIFWSPHFSLTDSADTISEVQYWSDARYKANAFWSHFNRVYR